MRDVEITQRKGSIELHGKGKKDRTVPLNAEARAALQQLGYPGHPDTPIVTGQRGPMGVKGIQKVVAAIAAAAKLDDCTCHTLRHTFCRRLAEGGARLEQIAALAGHESLDTTRRYVEPGKEELAAAVERLAGGED
jgi:site-specific recombinase XerD